MVPNTLIADPYARWLVGVVAMVQLALPIHTRKSKRSKLLSVCMPRPTRVIFESLVFETRHRRTWGHFAAQMIPTHSIYQDDRAARKHK